MSEAQEELMEGEGEGEEEPEELSPEVQNQIWIRNLVDTEGIFESPVDINITYTREIEVLPLEWNNFEVPPKKIKITNTGHTIIYSAKWGQERPHLTNGPFFGKYVFSNLHLHWGVNDMEGSEHTVDSGRQPGEMHVVMFKSSYLTQEAALKEQDGCATLVYFFKLQEAANPAFQVIVDALYDIQKAGTGKKIEPFALTSLIGIFENDYFLYWGTVSTVSCTHYLMWLISRVPIGVSSEQIDVLRYLFDENGEQLTRNFREVQPLNNRTVLHVNPSSSKYATLLPPKNTFVQIYRCEVIYNKALRFGNNNSRQDKIILKCSYEDDQEIKKKRNKKHSKWELGILRYVFDW
ncbi:hypothetical protein NQ317_005514 [Molorchus minor]|uniref:Alpha-carbonic anhydrase domain-containing protein n=1 Tax=Molorchus minor TaxID=1323400 RepID=A0ABQ9IXX4_9CUCU|nr:hypothetical protein NQ317_005514 [Molorchus minor]